MLKNIVLASIIIITTQTVLALNLDDVNSAANSASEAKNTASEASNAVQQASDSAEKLSNGSMTDMGKKVATDAAEGGVDGAVKGASSGSIVDGGTKGAVDGAKSSLGNLGL